MKKEKLILKKGIKEKIKNILIVLFIYSLLIAFLFFQAARIEKLDKKTETERNRTLKIEIIKEK